MLDGALSLALPTKKGQYLSIEKSQKSVINWTSIDYKNAIWFQQQFDIPLNNSNIVNPVAKILYKILQEAVKMNPIFLKDYQTGFNVETKLDFPNDWGLGSSSTLINGIAQWARVDAHELLQKTLGGSGYDVACAQYNSPILYQLVNEKPLIKPVAFNPRFKEQLYFVHLNQKQRSNKEIIRYKALEQPKNDAIKTVSEITELIVRATAIDDFNDLLKEHEKLVSSVLQTEVIQQRLFRDYFGQIKSLGAWGGDFVLVTGNDDTPKYFSKKGYKTILSYDEMVLNSKD